MKKRFLAVAVVAFAIVLIVCLASSLVLASTPPGQQGYEGQPGNQGGYHHAGQQGYEGQPGNQGGHNGMPPGLKGYEGQPGNQGGH